MKLYIFPPSPNSLRVQAVANQVGQEVELVVLDLTKGEHMDEEFVGLNPNHKIPTLVDGDFVLWESNAIMLYLAGQHPESGLVPSSPAELVKMHQWMFWNTAHFSPACGGILFERVVRQMLGLGETDQGKLKEAEENFIRFAGVLDGHLANNRYLLGEQLTVADHATGSFLVHADRCGYPLADYSNVNSWWSGIVASDAWQQALAVIPES